MSERDAVEPNDAAELLDQVSKRGREHGVSALSPSERVIFCVDWLDFEVIQGGLETFYMNTAGDHANITVEALETIGATECAAGFRSLHALFPGGAPAPTQAERYDQLAELRRVHGAGVFREWERTLRDSFDDLRGKLEEYLVRNFGV